MKTRWILVALYVMFFSGQLVAGQSGLNMHEYCVSKGYSGVTNTDGTAYGWKCVAANGSQHGLDMYDACAWQHGGALPVPQYGNFNDPNSWLCYPNQQPPASPPTQPPAPPAPPPVPQQPAQPGLTEGGMNIAGYCQHIGRPGTNNPSNGFDWTCGGSGISMGDLCAWQYGGALPYPGLRNYYDPNSWYCANSPQHVDGPDEGSSVSPVNPGGNAGNIGGSSGGSRNGASNNGGSSGGSNSCGSRTVNLSIGGNGRVLPGVANRLRSGPGTNYNQVGRIPGGSSFSVVGGPACGSGYQWWQVNYNGTTGWTASGNSSEAWIEVVGSTGNIGTQCEPTTIMARAHLRPARGGYVLEIMANPLPSRFEVYFRRHLVPDAPDGVQHNGYAGDPTSTSVFLGISTRFSARQFGTTIIDDWWEVRTVC